MAQNMWSIIHISLISKPESLAPTTHSNTLIIRVSDDADIKHKHSLSNVKQCNVELTSHYCLINLMSRLSGFILQRWMAVWRLIIWNEHRNSQTVPWAPEVQSLPEGQEAPEGLGNQQHQRYQEHPMRLHRWACENRSNPHTIYCAASGESNYGKWFSQMLKQ